MKKMIALLIAILMLSSMTACNKTDDSNQNASMDLTNDSTSQEPSGESTEEPSKESDKVVQEDQTAPTEDETMEDMVAAYFSEMPDHIYKIAQQEFVDKVAAEDDMVILDIRSAGDYEKGHVKGAINLPWGIAISDNLNKIPQDQEVFVYCYTGQTAGQAVMTLNLAGINARSVNLGWNLGISKVEGVDAVTDMEAYEVGSDTYTVDPKIQEALDGYYAGLADVSDSIFKNYKISEDNLKAMIDGNEEAYILSVRNAADYAAGHIAGAENDPFGNSFMDNLGLLSLPTDKKVVVYCYTGQTAGQVTAALRLLGYDAVSLNGGLGMPANAPNGWANKGYEVVTE